MFRKMTRTVSEPRKTNAFGWLRRRGGAGAVAAALALTVLLVSLTFTASAGCQIPRTDYQDEIVNPAEQDDIVPWEKPEGQAPAPPSHGAMPSRLPC